VKDQPEPPDQQRGSFLRLALAIGVVVALGSTVAWWLRPPATGAPKPPVVTAPAKPSSSLPAPLPAPPPAPVRIPVKPSSHADAPASPRRATDTAAASGPALHVSSDVDGADVFVDRQFVGKTPLDTRAVTPGHHQLNVSAPGYDAVAQQVEIAGAGTTRLEVSLKTVRLNASVAVLHKHTIGSCQGTLHGTPEGLRYETANASDAFTLSFADVEIFTVDYGAKLLRVKKRGGRTWNFTTPAPNADPLLSFQHDVTHARERLARGR
jgi:PEGA domain-containing protein